MDVRRRTLCPGGRDPRQRGAVDARLPDRRLCRMAFLQSVLDDPTLPAPSPPGRRRTAGAATGAPDRGTPAEISAPAEQARLRTAGPGRRPDRAPRDVAERHGSARRRGTRSDRGRRAGRRPAGRSPDSPTSAGASGCARCSLPAPTTGRPPTPVLAACVDVLRTWDWQRRPAGIVAVASAARPQLVRSVAEGLARIGRLPLLGAVTPVDGGPIGEPGGNSAFRLAGRVGPARGAPTTYATGLAAARDAAAAVALTDRPSCWSTTSSTPAGR